MSERLLYTIHTSMVHTTYYTLLHHNSTQVDQHVTDTKYKYCIKGCTLYTMTMGKPVVLMQVSMSEVSLSVSTTNNFTESITTIQIFMTWSWQDGKPQTKNHSSFNCADKFSCQNFIKLIFILILTYD